MSVGGILLLFEFLVIFLGLFVLLVELVIQFGTNPENEIPVVYHIQNFAILCLVLFQFFVLREILEVYLRIRVSIG